MARDRLPRMDVTIVWKTPIGGLKTFKALNKDLAHAKVAEAAEMAIKGALFNDDGVAEVTILVKRKAKKPI